MKNPYVCPKGCRLSKEGVIKERGFPLLCIEHKAEIEGVEIICVDCKKAVTIAILATAKIRCDSCQVVSRAATRRAYKRTERSKKAERARIVKKKANVYGKCSWVKMPTTPTHSEWSGRRSVRKPECKRYEECFELVDYRKHNAKMNCGICACFEKKNLDPAEFIVGPNKPQFLPPMGAKPYSTGRR